MPDISERTPEWRAGLRMDAERMRSLWAAVALNAMNEAAHEVRKLREENKHEQAEYVIHRFRVWAKGRNGRDVLHLAGIDHTHRAVESMCLAISSGHFCAYALRSGGQNRAS